MTNCKVCPLPVGPSYVEALDSKFHPDCFKCENCKASLAEQPFGVHENAAYCAECLKQVSRPRIEKRTDIPNSKYIRQPVLLAPN